MLAARIGVAGFGANSLSSQEAGAIRRSSRRDSKIPQACPAGFLCFSANHSETNANCLQINSFSSRSERVPTCRRLYAEGIDLLFFKGGKDPPRSTRGHSEQCSIGTTRCTYVAKETGPFGPHRSCRVRRVSRADRVNLA